jgi:hypothetical protein
MNSQVEQKVKSQIVKKRSKFVYLKNVLFSKFVMAGYVLGTFSVAYFYLKWQLGDYLKHSQDNIEKELNELKVFIDTNYKRNKSVSNSQVKKIEEEGAIPKEN